MRGIGVVSGCVLMALASFSNGEILDEKQNAGLSPIDAATDERLVTNTDRNNDGGRAPQIFSVAKADSSTAQLASKGEQDQSIPIMLVYVLGALVLSLITLSKDRSNPESNSHERSN